MSSHEFESQFTTQERTILHNVLRAEPYEPHPGPPLDSPLQWVTHSPGSANSVARLNDCCECHAMLGCSTPHFLRMRSSDSIQSAFLQPDR
jgi:hypothetical protein